MALMINGKKAQLDKSKSVIFGAVSFTAIVAVAALMISRGLWNQASYLGRVADKKEVAVSQLEANKAAITELKSAYDSFNTLNPNLIGGNSNADGERDGNNTSLILDSLPAKYDFPAVASSLEKLLFGYKINSMSGATADPTLVASDPNASATVAITTDVAAPNPAGSPEIQYAFEIETTYEGFGQMISLFDRSIRPFYFNKIELTGTNSELNIVVEGKTFYQPETGLKITKQVVQ